MPQLASAILQKWALTLGAYNYKIFYEPGSKLGHADGLSRFPLPEVPTKIPLPGETILLMESLNLSHVTAEKISQWTKRDPILSRIHQFLLTNWPQVLSEDFIPFQRRKEELSVESGCILWGSRVIVPKVGQESVLDMLHEGHPGISRMKALARSYVWWPGMDQQLENRVRLCEQCQLSRHVSPKVPLHPWEWPERPWSRIHVDYAGPFMGKWFLLVVDAHSKWIEVGIVSSATSTSTIQKLRAIFSTHGLPEVIVSDNGTLLQVPNFKSLSREIILNIFVRLPIIPLLTVRLRERYRLSKNR